MDFQTLGDWCKWLEKNFSNEVMIPTLPVIIRLDGNNFHNWTKGLERPFDKSVIKEIEYPCAVRFRIEQDLRYQQ